LRQSLEERVHRLAHEVDLRTQRLDAAARIGQQIRGEIQQGGHGEAQRADSGIDAWTRLRAEAPSASTALSQVSSSTSRTSARELADRPVGR
jgi:hypothetical protein